MIVLSVTPPSTPDTRLFPKANLQHRQLSVGSPAMIFVIWLRWREPTHNLCIPVRSINGLVACSGCIVVAEFDRLRTCSLSHDALSDLLVECRNSMEVRGVGLEGGGIQNFLSARLKKSGVMWLRLWQPPSNHSHGKKILIPT